MRFRSDPARIRGSIAPVVTPFDESGAVDLDALAKLIEWQIESGSHGISVHGSTGEPSTQSVEEREAVLEVAARTVADRVPFFPGTGSTHLEETLRLTAKADELGADAVLVITPYYSRPTQQGLFEWYSAVAREFPDLPMVVYNVPIRTAVDIAPQTVGRLRRAHDNIVGIKETTKDFEHASYVLAECGRDFLVYCGIELLCYPMLAIGGVGHLSCVANVAPKPCVALYDAFVAGDFDEAAAAALRAPPARRHGLRGDESRAGEVGDGADRRARLRRGAPAAGRRRRHRAARRSRAARQDRAARARGRAGVSQAAAGPDPVCRRRARRAAAALHRRRVPAGAGRHDVRDAEPGHQPPDRRGRRGPCRGRGRRRPRGAAGVRRRPVASSRRQGARCRAAADRDGDPGQRRGLHRSRVPRHRPADRTDAGSRRARRRELRLLRRPRSRSSPGRPTASATTSSTTRSTSPSAWRR